MPKSIVMITRQYRCQDRLERWRDVPSNFLQIDRCDARKQFRLLGVSLPHRALEYHKHKTKAMNIDLQFRDLSRLDPIKDFVRATLRYSSIDPLKSLGPG